MQPPQITIDQAKFLSGLMAARFDHEHETTKRVIEAVPLDKGDYRPDPFAKTAIELAWHIAASEQRFLSGICSGAFDFSPINRPDSVQNPAQLAAWFDESYARNIAQLKQLTGEQLARTIDFRGMMQLPAVMFLQLGLNHTIHHRGQLSVYLRPAGAKVPSIYGESYDSAQARMAAEGKAS